VQYYFEASKTTHAITADLDRFADLAAARKADIHLVTVRLSLSRCPDRA
jgi:hypothetical protein